MMPGIFAGGMSGGNVPPPSGFWAAIAASNPEVWLKLNEASGSVAVNSGSGVDGAYGGTVSYLQGALCSTQASANSVQTVSSPSGYAICASGASATTSGVIGICYAGTGATAGGAAHVPWRTVFSNTSGAYLRLDQANIIVQPRGSAGAINTGVASAGVKDGNPHLIIVGNVDGSSVLKMWIDGDLVWTHGSPQTLEIISNLVIARNGNTSQYALGRFADAFLSVGVTTAQVSAINSSWAP